VECHIVKRLCRTAEVDSFELGGSSDTDAATIAREGFNQVTVMVDAARWLQVGTELRRANGELIGAYYFREIELNPAFSKDTFEKDGLLKK
jgi:outer membrane lipoprotein-sorting protein